MMKKIHTSIMNTDKKNFEDFKNEIAIMVTFNHVSNTHYNLTKENPIDNNVIIIGFND